MKYDISHALIEFAPESRFILRGSDYSSLEWLDTKRPKPTEDEINKKIAELDSMEAMNLLREERNSRLAKTDWRASSDLILSDAWKTYRQALRDLPETATPKLNSTSYELDLTSVNWPEPPTPYKNS
tara:strand:- start:26 stop:406 length:381 start_codon:yes stop_codon:yes gene_type:complete